MTDKYKKASEIARLVGVIQDLAKDIEQDATSVLVYKDKVMHLSEIRDGAYAIVGYVKELEKLVGDVEQQELKRCPFCGGEANGIVIHYTANPGTTAMQNRNYFEGLKDSRKTRASSHFIVGLKGEIVQCVPTWEIAYASNERNADTVSIETCHKTKDGTYTKETYESMVHLTAWLLFLIFSVKVFFGSGLILKKLICSSSVVCVF